MNNATGTPESQHSASTAPSETAPSAPTNAELPAPAPWTEEDQQRWGSMLAGTLFERCEMRILTLGPTGGTMTMPVEGNTQPARLLHGGASIALAESVASMAAVMQARSIYGEGAQAVGTSVTAHHHRSARAGEVTATATALHLGRRVATYLVNVHREDGVLLSTITVSTMLLPPA